MRYIEFLRPNGRKLPHEITLDDRSETLYRHITKHPDFVEFTCENLGGAMDLCCTGRVDISDPDESGTELETQDVISEGVMHADWDDKQKRREALAMVIAKAADYFNIHIPDE